MITFLDTTTSIVVPTKESDVLYDSSITKTKKTLLENAFLRHVPCITVSFSGILDQCVWKGMVLRIYILN